MESVKVSIIIRNKNEGIHLQKVLKAIRNQVYENYEIILVDNESSDQSLQIAQEFGYKIVNIPKSEFTYGRALNKGFEVASGELCITLSAHSMPIGNFFINDCVLPFLANDIAAARCCFAGKLADNKPFLFPEILDSTADLDTIISKGPLASGSVFKRSVWEEIPFDENVKAVEDKFWGLDAVNKGYKLYANCGGSYFYIKKLTQIQQNKKSLNEYITGFKEKGMISGFVNISAIGNIKRLFFQLTKINAKLLMENSKNAINLYQVTNTFKKVVKSHKKN